MRAVFARLLSNRGTTRVTGSRKGDSTEIFGALLELKNPRARLSRSQARARIFSAMGELVWYLAGDNSVDFIEHYIPGYSEFSNDGTHVNGAYGPRLFGLGARDRKEGKSEWNRVISLLRNRLSSRNAVIQLYSNSDAFEANKDIPCTCTLHFAVRSGRLNLHVHMRSNDAFKGLPHDIFSFTMLQEIATRELDLRLGRYQHSIASLHLYDDKEDAKISSDRPRTEANRFLNEGLYDYVPMPAMPFTNPWISISELVRVEEEIRLGNANAVVSEHMPDYWLDLVTILRIHYIFQRERALSEADPNYVKKLSTVRELARKMSSNVYRVYVQDRLSRASGPVVDLFSYTGAKK